MTISNDWMKRLESKVSMCEQNHSRWIQLETEEVRKLMTKLSAAQKIIEEWAEKIEQIYDTLKDKGYGERK